MDSFISNKPSLNNVLADTQLTDENIYDDDDILDTLPSLIFKVGNEIDPLKQGVLLRRIDAFTGSRTATDALISNTQPVMQANLTQGEKSEFSSIMLAKQSEQKNVVNPTETNISAEDSLTLLSPIAHKFPAINHCEFIGGVVTQKSVTSHDVVSHAHAKPLLKTITSETPVPFNTAERYLKTPINIARPETALHIKDRNDSGHEAVMNLTANNSLATGQGTIPVLHAQNHHTSHYIDKHQLKNSDIHSDTGKQGYTDESDTIKLTRTHGSAVIISDYVQRSHIISDIAVTVIPSEPNPNSLTGLVGFPIGYQNIPVKNFGTLSWLQVLSCILCAALSWKHIFTLGGTNFSSELTTGAIFVVHMFGSVALVIGLVLTFFNFRYATVGVLTATLFCLPLYIYFLVSAFSIVVFSDNHTVLSHALFSWGTWGVTGILGFTIMCYLYRFPETVEKKLASNVKPTLFDN